MLMLTVLMLMMYAVHCRVPVLTHVSRTVTGMLRCSECIFWITSTRCAVHQAKIRLSCGVCGSTIVCYTWVLARVCCTDHAVIDGFISTILIHDQFSAKRPRWNLPCTRCNVPSVAYNGTKARFVPWNKLWSCLSVLGSSCKLTNHIARLMSLSGSMKSKLSDSLTVTQFG